jgi:hypothetical protein
MTRVPEPGGADRIAALFTRSDGAFRFARWARPLAPVIFGTDAEGDRIFLEALTAVAGLAGLAVNGSDPELGANLLVFFCEDWAELTVTPGMDRLVPDVGRLVSVLKAAGANQYRIFAFDERGAIRLCLVLLRYDDDLRRVSARTLAVTQGVQSLLLWSDDAFRAESPVALWEGRALVKPWFADLVRAAYDPVLPAASADPALALRLAARMGALARARDAGGAEARSAG